MPCDLCFTFFICYNLFPVSQSDTSAPPDWQVLSMFSATSLTARYIYAVWKTPCNAVSNEFGQGHLVEEFVKQTVQGRQRH